MAAMAEEKSDSMQSVEIPPDMFNQLLNHNGQVGLPIGGEGEFDSSDLMQLPVMKGLQEEESRPHLKILEQPRQRGFRFRYGCEGPSHGGLPGHNSQRGKRSFPSVEICNYKGPARIVVSLVTSEDTPRPHAHSLVGKHCKDGLCTVQVGPKDMTASFPNLGILHVTRKDVVPTLKTRILAQHRLYKDLINISQGENRWMEPSDAEIEKKAKEMAKDMDLSVVRLCFQTYLPDSKGHFTQPLDPVISVPVFDSKAPNATTLKICRMDKSAGCCTGGEEVYLLCDKVQKEDIQVKFFEISPDGQMVWQSLAEFGPTDVHRQYAIVFKTPAYKDINIDKPVYVHVQLKRRSDNETSDPKPFTFHPQVPDREGILRKRKKHLAHFNEYSSPYNQGGLGGNSSMGGAGAGGSTSFRFDNPNMGYGGSNYQFNQTNTSSSQPQSGAQQIPSHQSGVVANGNSSQQMVYTTSTGSQGHQPLPSIATLRKPQVTQQQQFQVQQHRQQMQQQQPASMPVQMDFQMPPMQNAMAGQASGEHVKMEGQNNYCMSSDGFELDSDIVHDCGSPPELKDTTVLDLIPKGISRPKDTEEKNVQTDDITIDSDSMAWHVAQVTANALHDYAASGDIKTILTVQRHLIAVEDDNGDTPLHAAIINKKYDVTHALLSAVIKIPDQTIVNQTNHMKQTPLHLAVLTKQAKMVEVLMRCGANPNLQDHEGNTPLHLATRTGMTEGINFLVNGPKAKAAVQPIKADVNPTNYDGLAPIHLAVISKNFDVLKMLVSAGADVNIPDGKTGRTAVHYAVEVESFLILGYLLIEAKVDVDAVTFSGDSALHLASSLDLRAMATLLIAGGADPKLENGDMEDDSDGEEDEKDEEKDKEEEEEKEKHGKTPYQLASSAKMKEILSGHMTRKISSDDYDYIETKSTTSSIGSIQSEDHAKINSWDQGYFSEKINSSGLEMKRTWPRVKSRMLGSSLITSKGDIGLLSETTVEKLASMLDENYPTTQSWFTLANRLGLSNMLDFLKHVPSPTAVILKQFEAMDGTIKELRDVLSSMNHFEAVTLLDQAISWRQEKVEEVQRYSSMHQSLATMNLSDGHQLQHQAVH
nr:nuclear factor NF-kappa-B p105 subunit-like [Lytechinus pictus]